MQKIAKIISSVISPKKPMNLLLFADGASRGNPGHSSAGVLITDEKGTILKKISHYLGKMTNNQAEYRALLMGLEEASKMNPASITCYLDSLLVVQQVTGRWKVKHQELQPLVDQAKLFVAKNPMTTFHHIPREKNTMADKLANQALDQEKARNVRRP